MTYTYYNFETNDSAYAKVEDNGTVKLFSMGNLMIFKNAEEAAVWLLENNFKRI